MTIILDVVTNFVFGYGARRLWRWEVFLDLSGAA
ncbi:hypothetical protein SEEM1594_26470 [Salmonella enterica subsp. enterica serovar Muenchen str. baa1594]|nr:hypothetical protein SEEM1594_26470 [Salmonella enterica subsp. enterica serovar Muenchen str. baa1594]